VGDARPVGREGSLSDDVQRLGRGVEEERVIFELNSKRSACFRVAFAARARPNHRRDVSSPLSRHYIPFLSLHAPTQHPNHPYTRCHPPHIPNGPRKLKSARSSRSPSSSKSQVENSPRKTPPPDTPQTLLHTGTRMLRSELSTAVAEGRATEAASSRRS